MICLIYFTPVTWVGKYIKILKTYIPILIYAKSVYDLDSFFISSLPDW